MSPLIIQRYAWAEHRQRQQDEARAAIKREAAECDCWRVAGPICARCKLRQAIKPRPEDE